jgi:hypothetical protein
VTFYHVYADESRQDAHRFMLYGLLLVPRGEAERSLQEACTQLRQKHQWGTGEFKWEKVSQGKIHVYKEFVDIFFDNPLTQFRCLVVDTHKIDYRTDHQGDRETAFYEFYFQALSRNLEIGHEYLVFTDQRQNRRSDRLTDLKSKTNYHWLTQGALGNVVRNVEPRDSKTTDALQITDVLLGAVGYNIEQRTESPAKVEMVRYISERLGCHHLREHQGRGTRFNIWRFRFPDEPRQN